VNHGCEYIAGKGGGVIQGTASEAVLVVLLAARDKILRTVGRSALPKLVMYASDQTHSSLQKACQVWLDTSDGKVVFLFVAWLHLLRMHCIIIRNQYLND
jgi:hypothetical protein